MEISEKIQICIEKIIEVLEKKTESLNEKAMDIDDLSMEALHSEIIENIPLSDNESGLSDLEEDYKMLKIKKEKIFEIVKQKRIVNNKIEKDIKQSQINRIFQPLAVLNQNNINFKKLYNLNDIQMYNDSFSIYTMDKSEENSLMSECVEIKQKSKFQDPYSNFNIYNRDSIPKIAKTSERSKNSIPFLKNFNPKFLKKENIDKKIFRKFRNYVKEKHENYISIFEYYDVNFWNDFSQNNLLPPMKYTNKLTGETVEFKSFNIKYFLWLFSQKGTIALFNMFLDNQGDNVLNTFVIEYDLNNSKEKGIIEKLKTYLNRIPKIYAPNISNDNSDIAINNEEKIDMYLGTNDLGCNTSNAFKLNFSLSNFNFQNLSGKVFKEEENYEINPKNQVNYYYPFDEDMSNLSMDCVKCSD